jgi:glycosyltransferase involved in cell wall biosynthesis
LDSPDEGRPIRALVDRLLTLRIEARVLCVARDGTNEPGVVEFPGLGSRWQRAFAVRRLRFGETLERPELLHVLRAELAPIGLAIAEHWGIPYVQTVNEFLGHRGRLKLSRRWCKRIVAASADLVDDLSQGFGVPPALLSIIAPGIMIGEEPREPVSDPLARVPVIGTAGPLVPASGFATFLNAARRVLDAGVDAEFVIAGQGESELDLRRRAGRLRIADRVTFVSPPVVGLRFWNVLDIFCQTSLVATVGRTLALALASGVPSIASDIEGLRTLIVHDKTGLLIPPDDSAALAGTILALLRDTDRATRLATQGREAIRRDFDPDAEARNLADLYRTVSTGDDPRRNRLFVHRAAL